ncbi:ABC transporter substrate-binding protein [Thauera sp. CAU 1555]|uniref:ABC transporter substrate-binding protein n=1 Tax=Thauera sedimentorum TaxID=2767595 RepID=A0ABR9B8I4_9RHOO|nr:ABC transporter substrate-binding protein [Thauera sedimentorum]MBC9071747.1 ABC transporter substrate-binding protein [Thauera sedimentorum]MBD8502666.1 ABC transporter substrate-binding protein [Thauera sedimentorum]
MRRTLGPFTGLLAGLVLAFGAHAADFRVALIAVEDDPRLDRDRLERAYLGHPGGSAADGLKLALDDAAFELEAAGHRLALAEAEAASAEAAREAAARSVKEGAALLVVDLPAPWVLAVADAVRVPVINVGEAADALREADCRANLFHTLPSERMRADALAQTLVERRWRKVLLLVGSTPADAARGAVVEAAAKRYGLKLVAKKPFKPSADPRERDLANPQLLTGGNDYDVVWVVDSDGEFSRALPYRTARPRPVVGDAGLVALAWHAQFERFGAPQVSRRFQKAAGRPMVAQDWAAWLAGKAAVGAVLAADGKGPAKLTGLALDGSKGVALAFRPWDGQLRQTLLLSDGQGVVASAPVDGILHPKNALDTLGADEAEKRCARPH